MGFLGAIFGKSAARGLGKALHLPKELTGALGVAGEGAGAVLEPFQTGGKIKGKRGKPKVILAHAGEFVLPLNAKPTKEQKKIVAKNKKAKAKAAKAFLG